MARKKLKKSSKGLNVLKLNHEELSRRYALKNGKGLTPKLLSDLTGHTQVMLKKWESELPQPISVISHLMRELDMTFEELVKEVYE